ncbi:MAG: response regulator [Bacteroidales bacterium]|nr:response regulator [Bacteroidales bacterium]
MEKKPLILAVDDIPVNRMLISSQLRFTGYDIITAASGPEALEIIRTNRPDIVLLDIMMPGMDGIEVLEAIRQAPETNDLPVLMLTSLSEKEFQDKALQKGANGYLTKPLVRARLVQTLEEILNK